MAKSIPEVKIGNEVYQIKDRTAREHLVEVSETQPESADNKLWIKNQEAEYQVPTLDEFNDLQSALESANNFTDDLSIDFSSATTKSTQINATGKWDNTQGSCYIIPVYGYKQMKMVPSAEHNQVYAMLKTANIVNGTVPDYATGYTGRVSVTAGSDPFVVNIPDDALYMYCTRATGGGDSRTPDSIVLSKIDIETLLKNGIKYNAIHFTSGTINNGGKGQAEPKRIRVSVSSAPQVEKGDIVYSDGKYAFKVIISGNIHSDSVTNYGWVCDWRTAPFKIPDTYIGKDARILLRKVGYESTDISSEVSDVHNHIFYIKSAEIDSVKVNNAITDNSDMIKLSKRVYPGFGVKATNGSLEVNSPMIVYDMIPVKQGVIYARNVRNSVFLDSNCDVLGSVFNFRTTKNGINNVSVKTVPAEAKYIRITVASADEYYLYQGSPLNTRQQNSFYLGKKMIVIGDSVPQGYSLDNKDNAFPKQIADYFGMTLANYSIGGSAVAKHEGDYDGIFFSLADFNSATKDTTKKYLVNDAPTDEHPFRIYWYENGEWTHTTTRAAASNGRSPMVDVITGADTDADVVFVMGGANDFMYHFTPFGEMTDRVKTTFYGALHIMCQYILQTFVNKQVFFCGALHRYQVIGQGTADWDCDSPDAVCPTTGKTLGDYMDAIKEVCAYYAIPFIDLTSISGFAPPWETSLYNDTNGSYLHPTVAGHTRLASIIGAYMESMRL